MKCSISPFGKLIIIPESTTEEYALKKWYAETAVIVNDLARQEPIYYRGSFIQIGEKYDENRKN